jgi:hypothetical protein
MNAGLAYPAIHWTNKSPPPKMTNVSIAVTMPMRMDAWRTRCATNVLMTCRRPHARYYSFNARLSYCLYRMNSLQQLFVAFMAQMR